MYEEWTQKFNKASMVMKNREEEMKAEMNAIECNLTLVGSTAIEDCL
jgi:hypothetical protein